MQYYRNKKFAAVKLTSQRTVTRHLTWFLQRETKYPQRKTIPTSTLILSWTPKSTKQERKIAIGEFQHDALKLKIEMGVGEWKFIKEKERKKQKKGRNKTKGKQPQQRRRVISFSPIYMSAGKWYMSFFSVQREMNETVLFIPIILEDR